LGILRRVLFVLLFAVVVYLGVSTFFPSKEIVGKFGEFLGSSNNLLFGYLSYVVILFLFWILFLWFFNKFNIKNSLRALGIVFIIFGILVFQSMIFEKGVIGNLIKNTLSTFIGKFGVSLFGIILFLWGLFLLFEEKIFSFIKFNLPTKSTFKKETKEEIKTDTTEIEKETNKIEKETIEI
jgi:S-DNA-T family DNA segregation ATPase FtsK/SpoIIIE